MIDRDQRSSRYEQVLPGLVDQIYRSVLCRPADSDGLAHYVQLLLRNEIDLRRLTDITHESAEYRTIVRPVIEQVRAAYALLFEREPTQAEIFHHVQAFRGSFATDAELVAALDADATMRARLGIRPLKIEMDITNQCNIRCIMCPFSDPAIGRRKRKDLDPETFARWSGQMFSWVASLGLMFGTEPTLNPHLLSYVRIAKSFRIPNVYFSTNAMKLTPALADGLIAAGLDEMNVSLDAATQETFERIRRGAKWHTVIGNLKSLRDRKAALGRTTPRLHLSVVMMRSNIRELPRFVELGAELGAVVMYFTHLVAYDRLGSISESLGTDLDEFAEYIEGARRLARQYGIHAVLPRTRKIGVPMGGQAADHLADIDIAREAHGLPRRFAADEAGSCCPFPWHFLAIEPDGAVLPCGWWHSAPPMGNLHTQSFEEIWQGQPRRRLREQLITRRLDTNCARCPAAGMGMAESAASFQSR